MSIVEFSISNFFKFCELFVSGLSVLLSWPVAVCGVAIYFMIKFHKAIDFFLKNFKAKLPGGAEISVQQLPDTDDKPLPDDKDKLRIAYIDEIAGLRKTRAEEKKISEIQIEELEAKYNKIFQQALLYETRYLNVFLQPTTKQVLRWFAQPDFSGQRRYAFHAIWSLSIAQESERNTILEALIFTGMIVEQDGYLTITKKGRLYVNKYMTLN